MSKRKRGDDPPEDSAAEQRREVDAVGRDRASGRFADGNAFRFPPGVSGNPAGRPAGWRKFFREHAESLEPRDKETRTRLALVWERLYQRAVVDGNIQAIREYLDRADGRVPIAIKPLMDEDSGISLTDLRITVVKAADESTPPALPEGGEKKDIPE